ncbi:hypothetical protein AMTR_s00025p00081620 [Amborella trichopoda]|uniref:Uncharacterized protein n=1 Tax=Amborella trichopoda TaxID=13333 RepID=W1PWS4_AMBTC|nr:hypothetical protein AMTR_s00025p00081620 [Amborella trichopoda]
MVSNGQDFAPTEPWSPINPAQTGPKRARPCLLNLVKALVQEFTFANKKRKSALARLGYYWLCSLPTLPSLGSTTISIKAETMEHRSAKIVPTIKVKVWDWAFQMIKIALRFVVQALIFLRL